MRKKRMKMTRSLNSRRRRVMPSSRLGFWHPSSYSPFPCFMKCLKQITNEVNNECLRFVEDRRGRRYEWNSIVCLPSKSINGTKFEYFPSAFYHWFVRIIPIWVDFLAQVTSGSGIYYYYFFRGRWQITVWSCCLQERIVRTNNTAYRLRHAFVPNSSLRSRPLMR